MYSEVQHIFFSSMSNPELFLIKDGKEELSDLEILKRPTLKFQTECHESVSSSSETHSQDKNEENNDQAKEGEEQEEERCQGRIVSVSKQSDSEASAPSSREKLKVEDEEDGFRTPTSLDHRIPVAKQCPPAPRKSKPSLKRKASHSACSCRHPLDLSKEVELLFPTQHNPLSDSHQSTKKVRREEPK